jgi:hypothetical protein
VCRHSGDQRENSRVGAVERDECRRDEEKNGNDDSCSKPPHERLPEHLKSAGVQCKAETSLVPRKHEEKSGSGAQQGYGG